MNLKRWFTGLCLIALLVVEGLLLHSNYQRDQATTNWHAAQDQLTQAQSDLETLKGNNATAQSVEVNRLRRLNEILTGKNGSLQAKVVALQATVDELKRESQQTAQHLSTARTALQLQQEHLQQDQAEQQQASLQACVDNLRLIDAAKQQWALDKNADANATPTAQDLAPYFQGGVLPVCPNGGVYQINSMTVAPTCSVHGRVPAPANQTTP